MTLSDSNLTSIDYTGCSGYDGITVLEPLFDKLVKKALANTNYSVDNSYHFDNS